MYLSVIYITDYNIYIFIILNNECPNTYFTIFSFLVNLLSKCYDLDLIVMNILISGLLYCVFTIIKNAFNVQRVCRCQPDLDAKGFCVCVCVWVGGLNVAGRARV